MAEGFGISGMPLIGKNAPTRPLGETGKKTTLFSWVPDGVVHAAVANFTDLSQIKALENQYSFTNHFLFSE